MNCFTFPVHAVLIFKFCFLIFRVAVAHIPFTTTFMLPWALIFPSLVLVIIVPCVAILHILGVCSKVKEVAVLLRRCLCLYAGTSETVWTDVAGLLRRERCETGQKSKAAKVNVRQEVYSQQMTALEIPWSAKAGCSCLVRIRVGVFSYLLLFSVGLHHFRRAVFPTTVQRF